MSNESKPVASTESTDDQMAAAREVAGQAAEQAKEFAADAASAIKALDPPRLFYLIALGVVIVFTLLFNMAAFSVSSTGAVSETVAQAQRESEAFLNSHSYSAFQSVFWGKLMWLAAATGIGLVIWSATTRSKAPWVPLAEVGCAAFALAMMLLLFFVGFPDLSGYREITSSDNARVSATLSGYWIPLLAAGAATFFSAKRILDA